MLVLIMSIVPAVIDSEALPSLISRPFAAPFGTFKYPSSAVACVPSFISITIVAGFPTWVNFLVIPIFAGKDSAIDESSKNSSLSFTTDGLIGAHTNPSIDVWTNSFNSPTILFGYSVNAWYLRRSWYGMVSSICTLWGWPSAMSASGIYTPHTDSFMLETFSHVEWENLAVDFCALPLMELYANCSRTASSWVFFNITLLQIVSSLPKNSAAFLRPTKILNNLLVSFSLIPVNALSNLT